MRDFLLYLMAFLGVLMMFISVIAMSIKYMKHQKVKSKHVKLITIGFIVFALSRILHGRLL